MTFRVESALASGMPFDAGLVRGACPHDCPDRCAWVVRIEDGVATSLVGDRDHPETRGVLCAKVDHYVERAYSPLRVLHPLRRGGAKGTGSFEQVSWEEALDEIAGRVGAIVAESGPTAILPYSFSGTQGLLQANGMGRRFFSRLGASRLDRTICGTAGSAGLDMTIGTSAGMLPRDLEHSRFIVLWGTNPIVTNLHLWPVIREARKRGATVVVIDPLKTRTAAAADWHIRPLPGSDAALALGMMHVIVAEGLYDEPYVAEHTVGFDALRERLGEYPPERAAELTGLDPDEIVALARAYARARPAAIRVLIGLEHHAEGEMMFRAIACLPALVGAWRERGGGLVHHPMALFAQALRSVQMPELESSEVRSVNMLQLGRALTDRTLEPSIRALFVYSSNPAVTTPNQNLVLQGLRRDDLFTVVHEQFMTDTARHADYVLPATTQLEHWDLMSSWGHTLPDAQPAGDRAARRGDLGHRAVPAARAQARLRRAVPAGLRRGDDPLRALERPPVPGRDHLRASARRRVGPAGAARAVDAARRRRLPDAIRQVRVLLAAPRRPRRRPASLPPHATQARR